MECCEVVAECELKTLCVELRTAVWINQEAFSKHYDYESAESCLEPKNREEIQVY